MTGENCQGTIELNELRRLLAPLFARTGVIKAIIFGSVSRGERTRKSDLDLMIVKETEKRFFDRFDEFNELHELLSDWTLDLLIYTPEELERISHRRFIKRILTEGTTLYEY